MAQDGIPFNDIQIVNQSALLRGEDVIYIVEVVDVLLVGDNPSSKVAVVNVYLPSKNSVIKYKSSHDLIDLDKQYKNIRYTVKPIIDADHPKSPLSAKAEHYGIASRFFSKKHYIRKEYEPPLYTTILVNGTDSFTEDYGLGFADYAIKKQGIIGNKITEARPVPTGLFISLESLSFIKSYIPSKELKKSIVDNLSEYVELLIQSAP